MNTLRQTEVELEQAIDVEKGRLDKLNQNIAENKTKAEQVLIFDICFFVFICLMRFGILCGAYCNHVQSMGAFVSMESKNSMIACVELVNTMCIVTSITIVPLIE